MIYDKFKIVKYYITLKNNLDNLLNNLKNAYALN